MKEPTQIDIQLASSEDAAQILALQKIAYQSEAEIYGDYDIPPLLQTLESIQNDFQNHIFLKALDQNQIIGSIKLSQQNGTCHIERLIVEPVFQNCGVGSALMSAVKEHFPGAKRYELFTGEKSEKNIYLYQKQGFQIFR